ncbi:MAG: DNA-binding response regulator, partial [Gammaproteobacteria bacterium]|nr:DNA-binding response regulator [Acidimicrobiaceae bacterium]MBQ83135.1 DNA-binding response regulator [Gammaproteobacteria bacterium]
MPYVLLVEDEESFADALMVGLTREGFDVEWVADGVSAIEAFERKTPDLVLLDVMLPNMSGLDVCRLIRLKSEVPIVMVTAKTEEVDAVVALELGADDYVTKPYQFRELVARVR